MYQQKLKYKWVLQFHSDWVNEDFQAYHTEWFLIKYKVFNKIECLPTHLFVCLGNPPWDVGGWRILFTYWTSSVFIWKFYFKQYTDKEKQYCAYTKASKAVDT